MRDPRIILGVFLGLLVGGLLGPSEARHQGHLNSDCDGALRELVIQYVPEAKGMVTRACRDFLRQLPPGVTVRVVCPKEEHFADFARHIGRVDCRLEPIFVGHPMTCWSRDRWIGVREGDVTRLLLPSVEYGAGASPRRRAPAIRSSRSSSTPKMGRKISAFSGNTSRAKMTKRVMSSGISGISLRAPAAWAGVAAMALSAMTRATAVLGWALTWVSSSLS